MLTRMLYFLLDLVFPVRFTQSDLATLPRAKTIPHPHMYAVFSYEYEKTKEIIKCLKRIRDTGLFHACAEYIYDGVKEALGDKEWILIPIPITGDRRASRGYNQTEVLAAELAQLDKRFTVRPDILYRTRQTRKQAKVEHRVERLQNQVESMGVKEGSEIEGKHIIIIDDVITTGATCLEAIRALKGGKERPAQILSVAIAH